MTADAPTPKPTLHIAGLAALWPLLHVSPYYPFSLATALGSVDMPTVSAHHALYSITLAVIFIAAIAARRQLHGLLERSKVPIVAGGALGCIGSLLLVASPAIPSLSDVAAGVAIVMVAFSVAFAVVEWFGAVASLPFKQIPAVIALSYCLFSAVWTILLLVLPTAVPLLLALCPLAGALCLAQSAETTPRPVSFELSSIKSFPWAVVALCVVFIYFGIIGVRAFTAMETGQLGAGNLGTSSHLITALISLCVAAATAWYFHRRAYSLSTLVSVFAFYTLVYMGSLLVMMAGDTMLTGKRMLVGVEHCFEMLLAYVLVCEVARRRLSSVLVFGLYGLFALTIPHFVSVDLMYQTGLLGELSHLPLAVPATEVASFLIAAAAIGLLVSFSSKTARNSTQEKSAWQEELCRRACAGLDVTDRELDVAVLTYRGLSAKKIAEALDVSESTVKWHQGNLYRKLGVHTKQELIALIDKFRDE